MVQAVIVTVAEATTKSDEAEGIQFAQPGRHLVPTREI